MSIDSGVDLEEELFPLVGWDALHEYSQRASFVEFISDRDEGLGESSDPSCFSTFGWENLFVEVGEQRCSLVDQTKSHHGDIGRRRCHGGA